MSRSVSFLRRITFKIPSSHTPVWIKQADLYEDESRIYAFLTFVNFEKAPIERVKFRIVPFDEGRYGMDPFGIQILNLNLKPGESNEHADPLILPKGTFGFNFSLISYGLKKKAMDVEPPIAAPALQQDETPNESAQEPLSSELKLEGSEASLPEASEPIVPEASTETEDAKKPRVRNPNRVKALGKMPILAIVLLVLLGMAGVYLLIMSGIWGRNLKF